MFLPDNKGDVPITMKIIETEMQARQELVQWGKELYTQGLVKGSGGNLSIRLPDGRILFTPTGFLLGHMTEECLSLCDENGVLLSGEKPPQEVPLHRAVYRTRPNVQAVCHTHSVYATAYASMAEVGDTMPIITPSVAAKVGFIQVKGYAAPGSNLLGQFVEDGISHSNAVLLANHGVVAVGPSMEAAVSMANEVENNAMLLLLGRDQIHHLSQTDVDLLVRKVSL